MTDTTLFTPQAHLIEQTLPAIDAPLADSEQEKPPLVLEEAEISPQSMQSVVPVNEATPVDPNAPAPAIQTVQPAPQEEELDELIIEDFSIDGICGVY